jgi:hypothetical protein
VLLPLAHCLPALIVMGVFRVLGFGSTLGELVMVAAAVVIVHGVYLLTLGLPRQDRRAVVATVRQVLHVRRGA